MNKYKVEITKTYCMDVKAWNRDEAETEAETMLEELEAKDMQHFKQTGDTIFLTYNVTDTDDPFDELIIK